MKKFKVIIVAVMAVISLASSQTANAQFFKWGPRVGVNINKLSFDKEAFTDSDNRAGFTGGLMMELTVPVIGVGVDVSAMYVHRTAQWKEENTVIKKGRDYVDIPVNLKWKINIPVVNNIIRPYIATGPSFAILTSKAAMNEFLESKKCNVSWNVGAGVELIKHLQIGASYGFGLGKAVTGLLPNALPTGGTDYKIEGKNKYWTVTAAWLF